MHPVEGVPVSVGWGGLDPTDWRNMPEPSEEEEEAAVDAVLGVHLSWEEDEVVPEPPKKKK